MTDINICVLGDGFVKGIGDSEMLGWADLLVRNSNKLHGPISYYNLGIPGQTSEQIATRVKELVPRIVKGEDNRLILCFGIEDTDVLDGKPRLSNQESIDALRKIILQTKNHCKLLMVGITPVYDPQRNNRIRRLNSLQKELCVKARVPFVDLFTSLSEDVQYKRELAKGDKYYPGEFGNQKIYDLVWNDRAWWFNYQ